MSLQNQSHQEQLEIEKLRLFHEIDIKKLSWEGLREGQFSLQDALKSQRDSFMIVFYKNNVVNFAWGPERPEKKCG